MAALLFIVSALTVPAQAANYEIKGDTMTISSKNLTTMRAVSSTTWRPTGGPSYSGGKSWAGRCNGSNMHRSSVGGYTNKHSVAHLVAVTNYAFDAGDGSVFYSGAFGRPQTRTGDIIYNDLRVYDAINQRCDVCGTSGGTVYRYSEPVQRTESKTYSAFVAERQAPAKIVLKNCVTDTYGAYLNTERPGTLTGSGLASSREVIIDGGTYSGAPAVV